MPRNTNINKYFFPVWEQKIYLENSKKPISGFKAIAGSPYGEKEKIFSVVSENYQLVTNQQALEMGQEIHQKLFPGAEKNTFEVFNIISPKSMSFCLIDIIDENYNLIIWGREVYVPFVRIYNSYNKSHSLKFNIGFCRKLCENGMILEQESVRLKFAHTKSLFKLEGLERVNVEHLKKLESDFILKTKKCAQIKLPRKYFMPLAAKTLNRYFDIHETDFIKKKRINHQIELFVNDITTYSNRYIVEENLGETAYAFYNVITDYASNNEILLPSARNGLQSICGVWINKVSQIADKPGFDWNNEIKDYEYLFHI